MGRRGGWRISTHFEACADGPVVRVDEAAVREARVAELERVRGGLAWRGTVDHAVAVRRVLVLLVGVLGRALDHPVPGVPGEPNGLSFFSVSAARWRTQSHDRRRGGRNASPRAAQRETHVGAKFMGASRKPTNTARRASSAPSWLVVPPHERTRPSYSQSLRDEISSAPRHRSLTWSCRTSSSEPDLAVATA